MAPSQGKGRSEPLCAKGTGGDRTEIARLSQKQGRGEKVSPPTYEQVLLKPCKLPPSPSPIQALLGKQSPRARPGKPQPSPAALALGRGPGQVLCWCVSSLCLVVEMSLPSSTQLPAHPLRAQSPPWRREVGAEAQRGLGTAARNATGATSSREVDSCV